MSATYHLRPAVSADAYVRADYYYDAEEQRAILPLYLPYTHEIPESRDEEGLEVEHIVSLREAHFAGMAGRSPREKREFAQDPLNQCLARAGTNDAKSDKSIVHWQPPSPVNLRWFAHRIVAVRAKYGLSVSEPERRELERILGSREVDEIARSARDADAETEGESEGDR